MPSDVAENPPEAASPRPQAQRSWLAALYPAIWRWHFWAGLLITPVLILLALTGGLYVFQEELRHASRPALYRVDPPRGAAKQSYAARVAAAQAALPPEWDFDAFNESPDPRAADELVFETDDGPHHTHRFVYVDPYRALVLGSYDFERSFFGTVIRLHTQLLAGTTGRVILEVTTCWGIVSLLTGLLLWWPRGKEKLWGVWLPRLRRGGRIALRDLHTLPGLYLFAVAFAIMFTGLLYTPVWGKAAFAGLYFGGQLPAAYVSPPKSTPLPAGATPAGIDAVVAEARRHYPFPEFRLQAPHTPNASWVLYGPTQTGDLDDGVVYLDATTGRTLATIDYPSLQPGAKIALMFYSIHTGSIFGTPTKVLAVIACLVIIAMSVTGVWMWWRRRPAGKFGAPRKSAGEAVPPTAVVVIVILAIVFPLVGASLLVLWFGELVARRLRTSAAQLHA